MGLEDILRQKAERRAEELRRQQEELENVARVKRALEEENAAAAEKQALSENLLSIEVKIQKMESLLADLRTSHEKATTSVAAARKERKTLSEATAKVAALFDNEVFRDIFAEEGITSLEDLMVHEDYADVEEVKQLRDTRESHVNKKADAHEEISALRNAKTEAGEVLGEGTSNKPREFTYEEMTAALQGVIKELSTKHGELFLQTPEGQEALNGEVFKKVKERHTNRHYAHSYSEKADLVDPGDLSDAAEFGPEKVKEAIKKYYAEVIDAEAKKKREESGDIDLEKAIKKVEDIPGEWRKIGVVLRDIEVAREEAITEMATLLGNDPESPFFRDISNYGRWHTSDPSKLARAFINSRSSLNMQSFGLGWGSDGELVEETLKKIYLEQQNVISNINRGDIQGYFPKPQYANDGWYETRIENSHRIEVIAREQLEFYKKMKEASVVGAEKENKDYRLYEDVRVPFSHEWERTDPDAAAKRLNFSPKINETFAYSPLWKIKKDMEERKEALEKELAEKKERMGYKVELDWVTQEGREFNSENNSAIYAIQRKMVKIENAQRLSPSLEFAVPRLEGHEVSEKVSYDGGDQLYFDSASQSELCRLRIEIAKLEREITEAERQIAVIDHRGQIEGDGALGGKRRKRESEKEAIHRRIAPERKKLEELNEKYLPKNALDKKLVELRNWLHSADRQLDLRLPRTPMTLKEFLAVVREGMDIQLTEEEKDIYKHYQTLQKNKEQAKEQYERKAHRR